MIESHGKIDSHGFYLLDATSKAPKAVRACTIRLFELKTLVSTAFIISGISADTFRELQSTHPPSF